MFHSRCLATLQRTSAVPLVAGILALWVNGFYAAAEQDEAETTEEIIVVATPLPRRVEEIGRPVEIVTREQIEASGAASVSELLERFTSVSVSERGNWLVQADLSIRASTFQQVLVTIDGIPVMDPQTAHHNMDLPIPLGAIERIEVLPGTGAVLFGPSAFAGTVNVVTRRPKSSGVTLLSSYGRFDTSQFEATGDLVKGDISTILSAAFSKSAGFRDATDYEVGSVWSSTVWELDSGRIRLSAGHVDKDFGAGDFYAPFPSHEWTSTTLFSLAPEVELASGWTLQPVAQYRRHDDEFVLVESNPSLYRNQHRSETLTERFVVSSPEENWGTLSLGVERSDNVLRSSNLGDRDNFTNSAFMQHTFNSERGWSAGWGVRVDDHSKWGAELSPTASLSTRAGDLLSLRLSAGRTVRPPSFTELFYTDPQNQGNPDLTPEEAWSIEGGFDMDCPKRVRFSATYFLRESEDLIDWVRPTSADPWQATNIGRATTSGAELALSRAAKPTGWRASYRYTHVDADSNGLESKYALNYARHDAALGISLAQVRGFSASVQTRYRNVPTLGEYWLTSARISRRWNRTTFFVQGSNLLDQEYEEIPDVPTPDRILEFGITMDL